MTHKAVVEIRECGCLKAPFLADVDSIGLELLTINSCSVESVCVLIFLYKKREIQRLKVLTLEITNSLKETLKVSLESFVKKTFRLGSPNYLLFYL